MIRYIRSLLRWLKFKRTMRSWKRQDRLILAELRLAQRQLDVSIRRIRETKSQLDAAVEAAHQRWS